MTAVFELVSGLDAELVRLGYKPSTLKWYGCGSPGGSCRAGETPRKSGVLGVARESCWGPFAGLDPGG